MSLQPPPKNWKTKPFGKDERFWMYLILFMILMMATMTLGWLFAGDQNTPTEFTKYDSTDKLELDFATKNAAAIARGDIIFVNITLENGDTIKGLEVLRGDVYMIGHQWDWYAPIDPNNLKDRQNTWFQALRFRENSDYKLHLGSIDVLHGFQLIGGDFIIALQIVPQYDYVLSFTPTSTGLFRIICNEYCGTGHHDMASYLEVV